MDWRVGSQRPEVRHWGPGDTGWGLGTQGSGSSFLGQHWVQGVGPSNWGLESGFGDPGQGSGLGFRDLGSGTGLLVQPMEFEGWTWRPGFQGRG